MKNIKTDFKQQRINMKNRFFGKNCWKKKWTKIKIIQTKLKAEKLTSRLEKLSCILSYEKKKQGVKEDNESLKACWIHNEIICIGNLFHLQNALLPSCHIFSSVRVCVCSQPRSNISIKFSFMRIYYSTGHQMTIEMLDCFRLKWASNIPQARLN